MINQCALCDCSHTFADFQILEQLRDDSWGYLYLVQDSLEEKFLLRKLIFPHHHGLFKDVVLSEKFDSSFIAKPIHFFEFGNSICVVYKYRQDVEHFNSLKSLLSFTRRELIQIIIQLVIALKCLHQNSIIFRDLKFESIFIWREGGIIRTQLFDFCAACYSHDTQSEILRGTIPYMAPELFFHNSCTFMTDIWALGVVFYFLVTSKFPFPSPRRALEVSQFMYTEKDCFYYVFFLSTLSNPPKRRWSAQRLLGILEDHHGDEVLSLVEFCASVE
ncbi:hypothetical protein RCL1_006793 [Eukaryota sp. TZLM3-RCL]